VSTISRVNQEGSSARFVANYFASSRSALRYFLAAFAAILNARSFSSS
jgi:hypothetical protein